MSHPELFVLGILRALVEVAMLFLLGQGLLALLAGRGRDNKPMYRLFLIITGPVVKAMRFVTPRQIIDRHIPYMAFAVLFWLWIALAWLKRLYCDTSLLQCF